MKYQHVIIWNNSIGPEQIDDILEVLPQILVLSDACSLVERAWSVARSLDYLVYACLYLALAEANRAPLVTDDRALLRKALKTNFPVRALQGSWD